MSPAITNPLSRMRSRTSTRPGGRAVIRVCLLYTSDAADERSSVDLGGRRIIKKKKNNYLVFFFFQAEDGIRDAQESRGLGDVYKRQVKNAIENINQARGTGRYKG